MTSTGVSVIVHTLDPGPLFRESLASVAWADEIVVLDMGSTDGTREHARERGARVVDDLQVSYVELARQRGLEQATQPWTLVIDPDEVVSTGLRSGLIGLAAGGAADAALLPRKNWFFGRPVEHGAFGPARDLQLRFFRTGSATWPTIIHARPVLPPGARVVALDPCTQYLAHFAYTSPRQFLAKLDRYTAAEAEVIDGRQRSLGRHVCRRLLNDLVRLRGYKDGRLGLQLALLMALYDVVQDAKIDMRISTGGEAEVAACYLAAAERIRRDAR